MQEKVFFPNSRKDLLAGILSSAGPGSPAVVLAHGFSTSKDSPTCRRLEERLNARGMTTLRFDFYGHGESAGRFEHITPSEGVDDILQALAFLRTRGYKRLALAGSSFGGFCVLQAAARDPGLFALVLKCPVSSWTERSGGDLGWDRLEEWKEQGFITYTTSKGRKQRLNYTFAEDAAKHSGYEAAPLVPVPTLVVHGDKDTIVPLAQSERLVALLPRGKLAVVQGAGHDFLQPHLFEQMLALITTFIVQQAPRG